MRRAASRRCGPAAGPPRSAARPCWRCCASRPAATLPRRRARALEVGATRRSGDAGGRDRRHPRPRSPISRAAPAATPIPPPTVLGRCSGSTGRRRRRRWRWRCSSSRSSRTWAAGGGSAPCRGRCRPCRPRRVASPEVDVAPRLPPRKTLPEPVSLRQRLVQSADLPASQLGRPEMDDELIDGRAPVPGAPRAGRRRRRRRADAGRPQRAGRSARSPRSA